MVAAIVEWSVADPHHMGSTTINVKYFTVQFQRSTKATADLQSSDKSPHPVTKCHLTPHSTPSPLFSILNVAAAAAAAAATPPPPSGRPSHLLRPPPGHSLRWCHLLPQLQPHFQLRLPPEHHLPFHWRRPSGALRATGVQANLPGRVRRVEDEVSDIPSSSNRPDR